MTCEGGVDPASGSRERFPRSQFMPWVGPNYDQGVVEGLRFLILGESHYDTDTSIEYKRALTTRVVTDYLCGKKRHRFVRSVTNVVLGPASDDKGLATLWNGSAFYNYVQEYAGAKSRQRPSTQAWQRSEMAFRDVLAALRPHLILVCGSALWEHVKHLDGLSRLPKQGSDDRRVRSRLFEVDDHVAVGGAINHPAWPGFRPAEWHPRVRRYIERAHAVKAGRLDA